jgi:thiol-disulfide isomerase/thioredoxin
MKIEMSIYSSIYCGACNAFKKVLPKIKEELKKKFDITFNEYIYQVKDDVDKFDDEIVYFPFIRIKIDNKTYEYRGDRSFEDFKNFIERKIKHRGQLSRMTNDKYYDKYLKYKRKYLMLKKN